MNFNNINNITLPFSSESPDLKWDNMQCNSWASSHLRQESDRVAFEKANITGKELVTFNRKDFLEMGISYGPSTMLSNLIHPNIRAQPSFNSMSPLPTGDDLSTLISLFKDFTSRSDENFKYFASRSDENFKDFASRSDESFKDLKLCLTNKKEALSISRVKESQWKLIQDHLKLDFKSKISYKYPDNLKSIEQFIWNGDKEIDQMDEALTHLRTHFSIQGYQYENTCGKKEFLYTDHISLPNIFKGNVDIVVAPIGVAPEDLDTQFIFAIELKTTENKVQLSRFQALTQLLCSNIRSSYPVVHIITDLATSWRFRWFEDNTLVTCSEANSPSKAYEIMKIRMKHFKTSETPGFLERTLTTESKQEELFIHPTKLPFLTHKSGDVGKTVNPIVLGDEILNSLEDNERLFINSSKFSLPSNSSEDVAKISDLFDVLDEKESKDLLTHHLLQVLINKERQTKPPDQIYI